jgi:hypothetical protein
LLAEEALRPELMMVFSGALSETLVGKMLIKPAMSLQ